MQWDIIINLTRLVTLNLSPTEYCYLICLLRKESYIGLLTSVQETNLLKSLEEKRYLKIINADEIVLRQKALNILNEISPHAVEEWIDEWRELFPSGVKTAGRPVRGDKKGCLKKMIKFCKDNPEYTKENIIEATKIYVFDKRRNNYAKMTCADYFIMKDGISLLASLLEDLEHSSSYLKTIENGGSPFEKEI